MRKKTAKKLFKCVDDILSSMEMLTKFKGNSYMVSKVKKVCSDNAAVLENEKDAGQRYSELLNEFKKKIESSDIEGAKKTADDFKNLISDSVFYKVVFMPYKASMWDSLESVWMAADKDERCEALVVPITYYEFDNNQNPIKKVNERNIFPEYVNAVNDEEYDLENDLPDIIYIHNPYDDNNLITRVDSRYYSWNLKKYCEKLVYLPYYKWIDGVSSPILDDFSSFVDYLILGSDAAVSDCKKHLSESADALGVDKDNFEKSVSNKLLGIGSPYIDKVRRINKNNTPFPSEWDASKMNGKKVFLYNLTLREIFNFRSLGKVKHTLDFFKENRDDVCVILRPHPLMRAALNSMFPNLLAEYDCVIQEFIRDGYGVLDEKEDMYVSFVWSDACYGMRRSSLTELYRYTGKPLLVYDSDNESNHNQRCEASNMFTERNMTLPEFLKILRENKGYVVNDEGGTENGKKIHDFVMHKILFNL
ncbi:hypothetical protein [Ligilactobacillus ruminis]|uniref:hypothetical protein n=1 Tax=Ligilactobacillus ruminis TaxID=1623 RepID=UPI0009BBA947|nr:hypothetical protein [Ligilactobacillus ruminis]